MVFFVLCCCRLRVQKSGSKQKNQDKHHLQAGAEASY